MLEVMRRVATGGRSGRLQLAVGIGSLLAIVVPAQALGSHATSKARASAASAPKCKYVFYDAKSDAPDPFTGKQDKQLDIVQGTLGLNPTHTKLRVVMTFKNLSKKIPAPANF